MILFHDDIAAYLSGLARSDLQAELSRYWPFRRFVDELRDQAGDYNAFKGPKSLARSAIGARIGYDATPAYTPPFLAEARVLDDLGVYADLPGVRGYVFAVSMPEKWFVPDDLRLIGLGIEDQPEVMLIFWAGRKRDLRGHLNELAADPGLVGDMVRGLPAALRPRPRN